MSGSTQATWYLIMYLCGSSVSVFWFQVDNEHLYTNLMVKVSFYLVILLFFIVMSRSLSDVFGQFESQVRGAAFITLSDKQLDHTVSDDDLFGIDTEDKVQAEYAKHSSGGATIGEASSSSGYQM